MDWDGVVTAIVPEFAQSAQVTCMSTPVELEGQLADGRWWYFRARWSEAGLGIGDTLDEAMVNETSAQVRITEDDYAAGYLTPFEALAWLRAFLAAYR